MISESKNEPAIMGLTIFQRLTAGYLAIMFIVLSFGGYVAFQLNRLVRITHAAAGVDSDVILIAESLSSRLFGIVSLEKKYWISNDRDFYLLFLKRWHEYESQLETLGQLLSETDSRPLSQQAMALSASYFNAVKTLADRPDTAPSPGYEPERDRMIQELSSALSQIFSVANRARDQKIRQTELISTRVLRMTLGFAAVCIVVGLAVSLLTTRSIVRPILVFQHSTRDIAAGSFVTIGEMRAPPEIKDLADDFNVMSTRLKELDELKEDFVSHVSHALRTPLTAIKEASEMLIAGTFENDPDSRQKLLAIVRDECLRLIVTVNRILDLSRMESGMMDYQFAPVDLNEAIRSAVLKLNPIARSKNIHLDAEVQPDLPPVKADRDQLLQLLENLIGNALKFTDPGGRVSVKIGFPKSEKRSIHVSITDTGYGIEPDCLESIFEKFRRIEKRTNTSHGSGLGLAISKHIVTAHGGSIWVESERGAGSTFYFSLPYA